MKIPNEWMYDEILRLGTLKDLEKQEQLKKMQREIRDLFVGKKFERVSYEQTNTITGAKAQAEVYAPKEYAPFVLGDLKGITGMEIFRKNFRKARPILIGPATLDCLLDKPVDDYSYVENGRLPFNPLFFETPNGPEFTIPVADEKAQLGGIYMMREKADSYTMSAIMRGRNGVLYGTDLFLNHPNTTLLKGTVSNLSRPISQLDSFNTFKDQFQFLIDLENSNISIAIKPYTVSLMNQAISKFNSGENPEGLVPYDINQDLRDIPNELFGVIPNLCVNLTNYINAHNVHVRDASRTIETFEHIGSGKTKKRKVTRPFSIVEIRDAEYNNEERLAREGHKLTMREYVRGHNRKLRSQDGSIHSTTWIRPYIRGPEEAPFRDQRHYASARKLLEERAMNEQYLSDNKRLE